MTEQVTDERIAEIRAIYGEISECDTAELCAIRDLLLALDVATAERDAEARWAAQCEMLKEQTDRFHSGMMAAFAAANVAVPDGPIPEGKSLGVWMIEILAAEREAAEAELARLRAQGTWQPIETAPKNARWIIAQMEDGEIYLVHFAEDMSGSEQPPFKGWFRTGGRYSMIGCSPIRWIPLPAPPDTDGV